MAVGPGSVIRVPGISQLGKLPRSSDKATFQSAFLAANGAVPDEPFAIFDKCFHLILGTFIVAGDFDTFDGHTAEELGSFANGYSFVAGAPAPVGSVDSLVQTGGLFFRGRTTALGSPFVLKFNRSLTSTGGFTIVVNFGGRVRGYGGLNNKFYVLGSFTTIDTTGFGPATRTDVAVYDPATMLILPDQPIIPVAPFQASLITGDATDFYIGGVNLTTSAIQLFKYNVATNLQDFGFTASATGAGGTIVKMVKDVSRNRIYIAGNFDHANGVARTSIAAFDATTGALITSFNPVLTLGGSTTAVTAMAVDPTTGMVFVSTQADTVNSVPIIGPPPFFTPGPVVVALDTTGATVHIWQCFQGSVFNGTLVHDLLVAGSDLIVAGPFDRASVYGGTLFVRSGLASFDIVAGNVSSLNLPLTLFGSYPGNSFQMKLVGSG